MRLYLQGCGPLSCVDVHGAGSLADLQAAVQERLGIPTQHQFLATAGGRPLRGGPCSLYDQGVRQYDTLQMCVRMRGGQPVKVKLLTPTPKMGAGSEVEVDVQPDTPMHELKRCLAAATGLGVERQEVMMAGVGRLVLIDRSSPLGISHSASTNNFYFATLPPSEAPVDRKANA